MAMSEDVRKEQGKSGELGIILGIFFGFFDNEACFFRTNVHLFFI